MNSILQVSEQYHYCPEESADKLLLNLFQKENNSNSQYLPQWSKLSQEMKEKNLSTYFLQAPGSNAVDQGVILLVRQKVLSKTAHGKIELCQKAKWTCKGNIEYLNELFVIKILELDKLKETQATPIKELEFHHRLNKIENGNIIKLIASISSPDSLIAVFPYYENGDMFHFMMKLGMPMPEPLAKTVFSSMVKALQLCHSAHICHRDVSLENFLVQSDQTSVTLIDFGLSIDMKPENKYLIYNHGQIGKIKYMAPEIFHHGKNMYVDGRKVDVWSLGVTLYMMATASEPFSLPSPADGNFRYLILDHGLINSGDAFSRPLKNLLHWMLQVDPTHRPTMEQILQHEWLCKQNIEILQ